MSQLLTYQRVCLCANLLWSDLAWAFVEAANFAVRYNAQIKRFYQRKQAKTNGVVAIKAVAHKLARACYYILRDQVPFEVTKAFA